MRLGSSPVVARAKVADRKGLLAMDESNCKCDKRFAQAGCGASMEAT